MGKSKNGNTNRGQKQEDTRQRVLLLAPRSSKPSLLGKKFVWVEKQ